MFCDHWRVKADAVNEIKDDLTKSGYAIIAAKTTRSGLWAVIEKNGERDIFLALLERNEGAWGYKDMDERMHPYYYDCPLEFLDLSPVKCEAWREAVRAFHGSKIKTKAFKSSLVPGVTLVLNGMTPNEVTIVEVGRVVIGEHNGRRYRLGPSVLRRASVKV